METKQPTEDVMIKMIENEIRRQTRDIIIEEVLKAQDLVERRLRKVADSVALSVLSHYEVRAETDRIIITVKKEGFEDG